MVADDIKIKKICVSAKGRTNVTLLTTAFGVLTLEPEWPLRETTMPRAPKVRSAPQTLSVRLWQTLPIRSQADFGGGSMGAGGDTRP
jgi:hypothetical protein